MIILPSGSVSVFRLPSHPEIHNTHVGTLNKKGLQFAVLTTRATVLDVFALFIRLQENHTSEREIRERESEGERERTRERERERDVGPSQTTIILSNDVNYY